MCRMIRYIMDCSPNYISETKLNRGKDDKEISDLRMTIDFLKGTNANEGYNVKVAHPLMVKAIAYAKVKTDCY